MRKNIKATLYLESKVLLKRDGLMIEHDPQGYLFSMGKYRTKILPEDLPEWYVYGYIYKRHGYISAKGVKHLLYIPNYIFKNHLHKYDTLYISYDTEITLRQSSEVNCTWYDGYKHAIGGYLIAEFADAAKKHSGYDVREIQQEIKKKQIWYSERNSK